MKKQKIRNLDDVKVQMDILTSMIQKNTTILTNNPSMYMDKVTEYRGKLYDQAMQVRKMLNVKCEDVTKLPVNNQVGTIQKVISKAGFEYFVIKIANKTYYNVDGKLFERKIEKPPFDMWEKFAEDQYWSNES